MYYHRYYFSIIPEEPGVPEIAFEILVDDLTLAMYSIIFLITGLVISYAFYYMQHDPKLYTFIALLNFFAFAMLLLVSAGNFLILFIG